MKDRVNRSVGIVLLVELQFVFYAVLQKRGKFNAERLRPNEYPDCLQLTCHGKVEDDEDFLEALIRESEEELGRKFTSACQSDGKVLQEFTEIDRIKSKEKEIVNYGVLVPAEYLKLIRLGSDSGGLIYFTKDRFENSVRPVTKFMRSEGPPDVLSYMFPDEMDAVKNVFRHFEIAKYSRKKRLI